ncbi:glycerophosphoryl diester phosphodiesterase [Blastococcus tunisiensis]|uniref:Glycerophosphoryl diester phosphodiesterase n=1 Tax=Blastococcus tunisiensis TaxID=1798228 RepID=A0A1I2EKQ3_9ACTN|nr:glycerophosphoryl diester phosphodiesterase [Blastococcus sp. DSM 46838]
MLSEVFALATERHARQVTLDVETRLEAGAPERTPAAAQFVEVVAGKVREAGLLDQVTIQSFDWVR